MPRKITVTQLRNLGACKEQVDKFAGLFGGSVTVTIKLCVEHAQDFCWVWASSKLLGAVEEAECYKTEAAARGEYFRALAAAQEEYDKVLVPARAEYRAAPNSARTVACAKYDKARTVACTEYFKARTAACDEYDKVCAAAFARAYKRRQYNA